MSLAQGVRGKSRHKLILGHRLTKYVEYMNRLIDGDPKVTTEMVTRRGKKLQAIRRNHVSKR